MKPRFINPYTDFGFKKLFGEEGSKHLLKDFLNQILPPIHTIKDLSLKKTEALPEIQSERSAVFDIYCEAENGSKFIVEMQKAKMNYFKDRMVLYSSFPIKEQAEKEFIISALKANKGKINQTVAQANIPKNTLLRKIRKYSINVKDYS